MDYVFAAYTEWAFLPPDRLFKHPLIWMPEINLGIGRERGTYQGLTREWLYWYDRDGNRYPTPEEQIQTLLAKLKQQGIAPDTL